MKLDIDLNKLTISELKTVISLTERQQPEKINIETNKTNKTKKVKKWTIEEDDILAKYCIGKERIPWCTILKKINRTKTSIYKRLQFLKLTNINRKKNKTSNKSKTKEDDRVKRIKFLTSRVKW